MIQEFKTLPESIRDWLASTEIVYLISQINKKLGLVGDRMRIVPALVYEVVAKDVSPQQVIGEISKRLEIGPGAARILAQELEERLLRPIGGPLRDLGIDIKGIYLSEEVPSMPELVKPIPIQPPVYTPVPIPIPQPEPMLEHNSGQEVMVPVRPMTPPIPVRIYTPPPPPPSTSRSIPVQINVQKSSSNNQ